MSIITVNKTDVDIYQRPKKSKINITKETEFSVGDLHANMMFLMHFLVESGVVNISEENYERLKNIYVKSELTKLDIQEFDSIIDGLTIDEKPLIRLIGDEICDRGKNDYFIFKILDKLKKSQVKFEILLSNHGIEFLIPYEKKRDLVSGEIGFYGQTRSMDNMQKLIKEEVITRAQVDTLVADSYLPNLKLISYCLHDKNITIYSHAGIGLETIKALAKKFENQGVVYNDDTAETLAQTIDAINKVFSTHVKENTVHGLVVDLSKHKDFKNDPVTFLIWNRQYHKLTRPKEHNGYRLFFTHGHDSREQSHDHIFNLNNDDFKIDEHTGAYDILVAQVNPSPVNILIDQANLLSNDVLVNQNNPLPVVVSIDQSKTLLNDVLVDQNNPLPVALNKINTHSLFPSHGYELEIKPDNLYLGDSRPNNGQMDPKMGVFYVSLIENNLSYTVKNPKGVVVTKEISLAQIQTQLDDITFSWPHPFSFDNLKPLLTDVWHITAERQDTLPNPSYIGDRTALFPSDHLPIQGTMGNINLVSWNTMAKGATDFSAFKFDEIEFSFNDRGQRVAKTTSDAAASRYRRIIDILSKTKNKNLIHLQETSIDINDLEKALGQDWKIIAGTDKKNGMISCYRTDVFELIGTAEDNTGARNGDRYLKLRLKEKTTEKITDCYNVWTGYNGFPETHEAFYRQKINQGKKANRNVIIAGDTNTRMLPVSDEPGNITTGLIPPAFLQENTAYLADNTLMIPDFPDGIICFDVEQNSIKAASWHVVDDNGDAMIVPAVDCNQLQPAEIAMRTEYRATLSIDALGGNTADNYLLTLASEFNRIMDAKIAIRVAVNSNNQRGLAVKFSSNKTQAYAKVKAKLDVLGVTRVEQTITDELSLSSQAMPVIIVAEDQCGRLRQALVSVANQVLMTNLSIPLRLESRIMILDGLKNQGMTSISANKKACLISLMTRLNKVDLDDLAGFKKAIADWKKETIPVTLTHWFRANETKAISHVDCIKMHRSRFFGFGKTASQSLLDKLEQDLEQLESKIIKNPA